MFAIASHRISALRARSPVGSPASLSPLRKSMSDSGNRGLRMVLPSTGVLLIALCFTSFSRTGKREA